VKYIRKFNESNYNHLRYLFDDFTDDNFEIIDIRHWSHEKSFNQWGQSNYGTTRGWIDGKFHFVCKFSKEFEFKEFEEYQEDLIDNIDTLYSRIKEVGEYLTIKIWLRVMKTYDHIEITLHKGNYNIKYLEDKVSESVSKLKAKMRNLSITRSRVYNSSNISIQIDVSFQTKDESVFEDKILQRHFYYIDSLNESILSDASSYLHKVFDRISKASQNHKKKILIYALSGLMFTSGFATILHTIKTDPIIKKELNDKELKKIMREKLKKSLFKDPSKMKISKKGWAHLKYEEGNPAKHGEPILKAYKIGDGAITIGWGHAEKLKHSKFVVGQTITREQAQKLLEKDATSAANGLRDIFKDWQKQGIERHITQDMFDAMVSMAINIGVSGLRKSAIVQELKSGNYKKAGNIIKNQNVLSKFPGLKSRRERESKLFLSYLDIEPQIGEI